MTVVLLPRYCCSPRCRDVIVSVTLQLWLLKGLLLQLATSRKICSDESNICYQFNHESRTHIEAENFCRSRNGTLATIVDEKTQQHIERLLGLRRSSAEYWIGGKLHVMHQWTWVDGTTYSGTVTAGVPQQLLFEPVRQS